MQSKILSEFKGTINENIVRDSKVYQQVTDIISCIEKNFRANIRDASFTSKLIYEVEQNDCDLETFYKCLESIRAAEIFEDIRYGSNQYGLNYIISNGEYNYLVNQ